MWKLLAIICMLTSASLAATDREPPPYVTVLDGSVDISAIPESGAIWTFFNILHHLERNRTGIGMMILEQSVGLTRDQAAEFFDYASSALNEHRRIAKAETARLYKTFCVGEDTSKLYTSDLTRVEWTNASSSMRMRLSNYRETRTKQIPSDMYPVVRDWVDANLRGNMRIHEIDRAKRLDSMRTEALDAPVPELRRLCEVGANGPSIEPIN